MVYFLDESGHQKLCNLLADGPTLLLVEATHALLYRLEAWPDLQGMLGDFPRDAGMFEGFHAKMSLLARRRWTSALSYLEKSVVPIRSTLSSGLLGSMGISLMPSVGSKDPASYR